MAVAALVLGLAALGMLTVRATVDAPRGVLGIGLFALALATTWYGLVRRGALHILGFAVGALLALVAMVLLIVADPLLSLGVMLTVGLALAAGSHAFRIRVPLSPAPRPTHPVVFWNPRSGGGKAQRVHLAEEARARGIEPLELTPGANLTQLVRAALDAGADALAMAGGDGSQAIVARFAADRGIPYACIPAGTRNHFALDLGVDRNDVVGALDAFVDGGERIVDLGEVHERTFVNNVSLGLYGAAVQRAGYRDAKVRTVLETVPPAVAAGEPSRLRWRGPDGVERVGGAAIVISNNAYRLGHVMGDGTRPRLDGGLLGVTVIGVPGDEPGMRTWTTSAYEVTAQEPVPAGVDGEAVTFDPPLSFRIRPGALRCRIARHHPGASPSAFLPVGAWAAIRTLVAIAAGRDPRPLPGGGASVGPVPSRRT